MHSGLNAAGLRIPGVSAQQRSKFIAGLFCSAVLHGLFVVPYILSRGPAPAALIIPIDVVLFADQAAGPPLPDIVLAPQQETGTPSSAAAQPLGDLPSEEPVADELELKLQRLAKLRQPSLDTKLAKSDDRQLSPSNNGAANSYAVSDYLRAQVERRWSLDLAALGNRRFSVQIRVKMTGAGVVTKAEIVRDSRFAADKAYQDIALSARNAVLLSSPLALPAGHYDGTMELTLNLSTADALR